MALIDLPRILHLLASRIQSRTMAVVLLPLVSIRFQPHLHAAICLLCARLLLHYEPTRVDLVVLGAFGG